MKACKVSPACQANPAGVIRRKVFFRRQTTMIARVRGAQTRMPSCDAGLSQNKDKEAVKWQIKKELEVTALCYELWVSNR